MEPHRWKETFVEKKVTYAIELDGKFIIVENVPARVCVETGERFFSPETVERLQQTIWGKRKPRRVIETPVFEFVA
jgi:YgiT-type zinc finger domain-containing protein